jgi:hypothetical protein
VVALDVLVVAVTANEESPTACCKELAVTLVMLATQWRRRAPLVTSATRAFALSRGLRRPRTGLARVHRNQVGLDGEQILKTLLPSYSVASFFHLHVVGLDAFPDVLVKNQFTPSKESHSKLCMDEVLPNHAIIGKVVTHSAGLCEA